MSQRTFYASKASEPEVVTLFAKFSIGAGGAPTALAGNGFESVAETATGHYTLTMSDAFFKFMGAQATLVKDVDGTAKTAVTGKPDVQTLTFPAKASATAGDHIVLTTPEGVTWAIALDVSGTDPEPTAATWTAVAAGRKVNVNISATTTAASVAAAVEAAFDALTGVGSVWATDDAAADGTMTFTTVTRGPVAAVALPKNADASGAGSITTVHSTTGVASTVDTSADTITIASHGWTTGTKVALTINSGSLPAGTSATNYWIVAASANTVKLASSLANAEAGTVVDITDQGTADKTMTLTPALSYGSGVAKTEVISVDTSGSGKTIAFGCYDLTGALVQPANGTVFYAEVKVGNSSVPARGE